MGQPRSKDFFITDKGLIEFRPVTIIKGLVSSDFEQVFGDTEALRFTCLVASLTNMVILTFDCVRLFFVQH